MASERARYDNDTKETVIALYKESPTLKIAEIAKQFDLNYGTVYSWLAKYNKAPNSSPQRRAQEDEKKEVVNMTTAPTHINASIQNRDNYPNYLQRERNEHLNEQLSIALSQLSEAKKELESAQQQLSATQDQLNESKQKTRVLRESIKILFESN